MIPAPTAPNHHRLVARRHRAQAARPLLAVGGSMISLFGVGLAIGSTFSTLDGGDFFLFAGFGLIVSGALLAKRHAAGAWTYMVVFAATLLWSLHDSGLGGSPVGYRIAGPIVMLVMLALLIPALLRWSRTRTVAVLAALIMATVMVGDLPAGSGGQFTGPALAVSQFHNAQTNGVLQ